MHIKKTSTKNLFKEHTQNQPPLLMGRSKIVLHNIRSMYNVGSVFRNADAFGIGEVLLTGFTPAPPRPEISKTAIGAEETTPWLSHKNPDYLLQTLSDAYLFIGIEQTNISTPLSNFKIPEPKPVCLFFGNEVTGLDPVLFKYIHHFVQITQYGHKHSLNISVSAGITMYAFLQKFRNLVS